MARLELYKVASYKTGKFQVKGHKSLANRTLKHKIKYQYKDLMQSQTTVHHNKVVIVSCVPNYFSLTMELNEEFLPPIFQ